jgi:NitT/TauT family transport system substrate-binding protein
MLPALLNSEIDVALSTVRAGLLNAVAEGGNLKVVADKGFADPNSCANSGWLARKELLEDGTLSDLSGLRGLKVVAFSGNSVEYSHDLLIQKAGLTNEDIEIVSVTDPSTLIDGLANGSIDVAPHAEPWITRAQKAGTSDLWLPNSEVIPNMSVAVIVYGPTILDENSDVGVRFMTAYLKAVRQYSQDKSDRNVEILAKYTKLSPEEIRESCWTSYQPDGKVETQWLMGFQQWALEKGYIDTEVSIEQIWDPQFVDQASAILNK